MLAALALVTIMCLLIPSTPSFLLTKLLFATVGVSFALIKVSVFATLGLITRDRKEHLSLMSFLESFFMIAPQCPAGRWWDTVAVKDLIDQPPKNQPIDPDPF